MSPCLQLRTLHDKAVDRRPNTRWQSSLVEGEQPAESLTTPGTPNFSRTEHSIAFPQGQSKYS
jgi:hypothetical protein